MSEEKSRFHMLPDEQWERRVRESMEAGREWENPVLKGRDRKVLSHAYDDIISLPHHVSPVHPPMSLHDRAAQFSPFAALSGFEGEIKETARLTDGKRELDEGEEDRLDKRLRQIRQHLLKRPGVTLTWFKPDERKAGGAYETVVGNVKKLDTVQGILTLEDGRQIPLRQIVWIGEDPGA